MSVKKRKARETTGQPYRQRALVLPPPVKRRKAPTRMSRRDALVMWGASRGLATLNYAALARAARCSYWQARRSCTGGSVDAAVRKRVSKVLGVPLADPPSNDEAEKAAAADMVDALADASGLEVDELLAALKSKRAAIAELLSGEAGEGEQPTDDNSDSMHDSSDPIMSRDPVVEGLSETYLHGSKQKRVRRAQKAVAATRDQLREHKLTYKPRRPR